MTTAQAVVYGLIADKCVTIYWHKNEIFTNLSKYFLLRNKTAHPHIYFAQ